MERFSLKKLNKMKAKEQYQIKLSNRSTDLENLMWTSIVFQKELERISKCQPERI
jgi:hypothetical protein